MNLFIRIKNGQPFEHPIFSDNFRQAFPDVDVNNLPPEFARFVRVAPPTIDVYEVCETAYEPEGGVYKDVHRVRPMTQEEKLAKQNAVKADWAKNGFPSWVFDEPTCSFVPPKPRPQDEKVYRWDEETTSWVEITQ